MKIATWNVNGIRARAAELHEWIAREQPDVFCVQEIKAAPAQLAPELCELEGYWCYWHGEKGYSGVGLHVRKATVPERPAFSHPPFDLENRIIVAQIGSLTVASVYVPNGGKDFPGKMKFLEALESYAGSFRATGAPLVICGDLNVARADIDVHPKERKPRAIGQLPEERALIERLIAQGLVDVARQLHPDDDALFTWWAPWRNLRQRNIGWRIDYVLASEALAAGARSFQSQREFGTSDHAPLVVDFQGIELRKTNGDTAVREDHQGQDKHETTPRLFSGAQPARSCRRAVRIRSVLRAKLDGRSRRYAQNPPENRPDRWHTAGLMRPCPWTRSGRTSPTPFDVSAALPDSPSLPS